MIFEETATFEKLRELAGTNVEILHYTLGARCKIISVDPEATEQNIVGGIKIEWIENVFSDICTWFSPRSFRLQP